MNVDSRVIVHAGDYLEKEMHFCFDSQEPMIQVIQAMDQHSFVKWLGKQSYFKMAKDRLEGHATVIDGDNPRRSEFRKHFALEGLFAFSLWLVKDMERLLPQVVVHKTEHETMMKLLEKLHSYLMEGKMYFGNGVKQQLLTVFIDDLLRILDITVSAARMKSVIRVSPGEIHRIVDAAERELAQSKKHYQRGGLIVAVFYDPGTREIRIQGISKPALVRALASIAIWERFDGRAKDWVRIDPPERHASVLFDAANYVHLLNLNGLARQPYLRPDGSLIYVN